MQYRVVTVTDDELPGTDWALVRERGVFYLFVKDGCLSAVLLNQTWPAFVLMEQRHPEFAA